MPENSLHLLIVHQYLEVPSHDNLLKLCLNGHKKITDLTAEIIIFTSRNVLYVKICYHKTVIF